MIGAEQSFVKWDILGHFETLRRDEVGAGLIWEGMAIAGRGGGFLALFCASDDDGALWHRSARGDWMG